MPNSEFDIAFNNARIIDGTGAAAFHGTVGVRNGRIAVVRETRECDEGLLATETVDAEQQIIAPGFIDLHSHADFTLESNSQAITQITQGVTTLLTGNCGTSPFPVADLDALQSATSFLQPELSWSWTDAGGYRAALQNSYPAINSAAQVGHGALRLAVVGDAKREASPEELARMCHLLRASADQGVYGFSTGLIYAPGSYATTAEITALAQVAADCGLVYSTHMRNETSNVLDAVAEAIGVARRTGVRLEISHIKAMGPRNHGKVASALRMMADARADGLDVAADVYPYSASSTTLTSRLPDWALDGGGRALLRRLGDAGQRRRISATLAERFDGEIDPAGIVIAHVPPGPFSEWVGHTLIELAAEIGTSPHEAALDLLAAHRATVTIINHAMAETDVEEALRDPYVSVASDGWTMAACGSGNPHPRNFGTFPRVLGHYARQHDVLSLEEAIRKMTCLPASRAGLTERGRIAEGLIADLTIFDPATITDKSTYLDAWQLSEGVSHVVINGRFAMKNYVLTAAHGGDVL
ncbi:N-acyl-D-amino-acid deacylase family protein [Arthrobacter pigmenti]